MGTNKTRFMERQKKGVEKINTLQDYDQNYYLVKEETTHYGDKKLLLKK